MRIILLQDVPKLGKKHEVKDVADGFARNVLLKQKKAVPATPQALRDIERLNAEKQAQDLKNKEVFLKLAENLKAVSLVVRVKADTSGHLFAAIRSKDIAEALLAQASIKLDPARIIVTKPIKALGEMVVTITNGEPEARHLETTLKVVIKPLE